MTANVQCAGGSPKPFINVRRRGRLVKRHLNGQSCGWKGEQFAIGKRLGVPYFRWDEEDRKARTSRPCPRCGGRVVVTPQ